MSAFSVKCPYSIQYTEANVLRITNGKRLDFDFINDKLVQCSLFVSSDLNMISLHIASIRYNMISPN